MKFFFFKYRLAHTPVQFFSVILLLCLNYQQSIASGKVNSPAVNSIEMLDIPAGEFMMGSHDVMFAKPPHKVTIAGFKLSKNEITYELYDLFVQQTGYNIPMDSWGRWNQPVTNVSWYDAQLFIKWFNSLSSYIAFRIRPHKYIFNRRNMLFYW